MRKVFCTLIGIAIFLNLNVAGVLCDTKTSSVEDFVKKVVELVIKRDADKIYSLTSDEFKKAASLKQLRDIINNTLSLYKGKPIGGSIVKLNYHSNLNLTEVWFKLNYENEIWLLVGCMVKEENGKLLLYGIRLNVCPKLQQEAIKSYPHFKEVIAFSKDVFDLISAGKVNKVMVLISDKAKKSVGEDLIRSFLQELKGIKVTELVTLKWNSIKDGIVYFLVFEAELKNSLRKVNLSLIRRKNGKYELMDINVYRETGINKHESSTK